MRRILLYLLILLSAPCCAATYKLVTDASELKNGDVIIIGADNDLVMSSIQSKDKSSFFTNNSFSYNDTIFNPLSGTIEFTLETFGNQWYLITDGMYLATRQLLPKRFCLWFLQHLRVAIPPHPPSVLIPLLIMLL